MNIQQKSLIYTILTVFLAVHLACGRDNFVVKKTKEKSSDAQGSSGQGEEAKAFLARYETEELIQCQEDGYVYDRRKEECLTQYKTGKFPCTRAGITKALGQSGSQVTQIMDRSLGSEANPGDKGEGFIIDQCGKAANGRVWVDLLRESEGKLQIREIEI